MVAHQILSSWRPLLALVVSVTLAFQLASAQPRSLDDAAAFLAPSAKLFVPSGPGPHPVFIYHHGCKLLLSHRDLWGEFFANNGYAMLAIDSFAPRGLEAFDQQLICSGAFFRGSERAGDTLAALHMIQNDLGVPPGLLDRSRIGVIGFSHGGWTTMDALAQAKLGVTSGSVSVTSSQHRELIEGINALVLMYPWCGLFSRTGEAKGWDRIPPTLFLRPQRDGVVHNFCDDAIDTLQGLTGPGHVVNQTTSGSGHAYDEPDGVFIPFEAEATAETQNLILRFLERVW